MLRTLAPLTLGVRHQVKNVVNWKKIIGLALSLFATQVFLGVAEGAMTTPASGVPLVLAGHAASFFSCSAIFALFAIRTPNRPFSHAWLGLLLEILIAALVSAALSPWLGRAPWFSVLPEWAVLLGALAAGTSLGVGLSNRTGKPADA